MKAHDERIYCALDGSHSALSRALTVQKEHDGGKVEGPFLVPEDHLTKIAHIANLGMSKTELPVLC